jgi:hypothetical protein
METPEHPRVLRSRRVMCHKAGKLHLEQEEIGLFSFVDYSWECSACGGRHCSTCYYETDGETITVYDCGKFG